MTKEALYRIGEWVEIGNIPGEYAKYSRTHGLVVGELAMRAMYNADGSTTNAAAYRIEMFDKVVMIIRPVGCKRVAPKRGNMDDPVSWYSMYEATGWLPKEMRNDY